MMNLTQGSRQEAVTNLWLGAGWAKDAATTDNPWVARKAAQWSDEAYTHAAIYMVEAVQNPQQYYIGQPA